MKGMCVLTNQPADWLTAQAHIRTHMWLCSCLDAEQTDAHMYGTVQLSHVAAVTCRPADSRENRICQIRTSADEKKHRSLAHTSDSQSEDGPALGTKAETEQQGSSQHMCAHTKTKRMERPMHTHADSTGPVRRGVRLRLAGVCAHMCVCQLSLCSARSPCVHLSKRAPGGLGSLSHYKTQNAMTNKTLISSFLPQLHKAQPNP